MQYNNKRILIIDDDTRIHEDFRKILGEKPEMTPFDELENSLFSNEDRSGQVFNFELDSAYQGEEGYEKVKQANQNAMPYALAFVDMRMPPGWDGLETIKHIWEVDKNIQLVICTAYSDYSWSEVLYHLGASDRLIILKKPFDMVEVQQIATALTTKWNLGCESIRRLKVIEESEEKYRTVVNSVDDTIVTMDKNGEIIFVNHNPWKMLDEAIGHNYYSTITDEYKQIVEGTVKEVIETGQQKNIEYATVDENKDVAWSEGRISPYYKNDEVVAATLVASDITVRKALDWQMRHDDLTGLANRSDFVSNVESLIEQVSENGAFAVIFIDLDHFNLVNDCFGHELGDKVLIEISRILCKSTDSGDMLARLGGDEFAILKHVNDNHFEVHEYVELLQERFRIPMIIDGFEIYPSVSMGIVICEGDEDTANSIMRDADAALYHAKSRGRNRYEFFDQEVRERIVKRVSIGSELRQAISNREFEVLYQPLASLVENKITGFEALIRWNHPERGVVSPVDFIPVAEETGLIVPITRIVLETAAMQINEWNKQGIGDIKIAVNCSAREFNEQKLDEIIKDIFSENMCDLTQLELELTESSIMDDVSRSIENMRILSDMGLHISIDDFGTGYSSFSYIKRFAIDKLKIDRAFVMDIPGDEDDVAIVEAIIAMAKRLKIKVVAEGVETNEQMELLKKAGCDYMQGYLLGKPMPKDEVTKRLQENDWLLDFIKN